MRAVLVAVLLLFASPAFADDVLIVTKAGYFLLSTDASGVPALRPIKQVIRLAEPPVDPEPEPDPTDRLAKHRQTVQAATDKVTDQNKSNTKVALAKLYRTVQQLPVTNTDQLVQATNTMFNALTLPAAWQSWKWDIDQSVAGFVALDDAKKAWQVVAEVLEKQ